MVPLDLGFVGEEGEIQLFHKSLFLLLPILGLEYFLDSTRKFVGWGECFGDKAVGAEDGEGEEGEIKDDERYEEQRR